MGADVNPQTELAGFVAGLRLETIPPLVLGRVKDIVLDALASAVAGRHGNETAEIESLVRNLGGGEGSTVIAGRPASLMGATMLNAYQTTAVTVCDVHRPTLCHVTPEIVPPALAVAEREHASGADFLRAVAAGLETTVRVGVGTNYEAFRAKGWHSPGVTGPFGAAAAVSTLLGLDATLTGRAFGLAGSQSAGTFAHWGTPTIKFHQSRGAASGLLAGLLAAEGFRSSEAILTHPDGGIYNTYSDGGRPDLAVAGLGQDWALMDISLRLWPAGSPLQALVTAAMALAEEHDLEVRRVASVRAGLSKTIYDMYGTMDWDSKFTALLSAPYITAVVLHDRQCWLEQFEPDRTADPDLGAFTREKVVVEADPAVEGTGASLDVVLDDGTVLSDVRIYGKGDAKDPLGREEIVAKFRMAERGLLPEGTAEQIADLVADLETLDDIGELCELLRSGE